MLLARHRAERLRMAEEAAAAALAAKEQTTVPEASDSGLTKSGEPSAALVRKWAKDNGIEVPARAKPAPEVYEAYKAALAEKPEATPPAPEPAQVVQEAGGESGVDAAKPDTSTEGEATEPTSEGTGEDA